MSKAEPGIRLVWKKIDDLIPYENNAKLHPQEQLDKLVGSFNEFGRIVPAGIDSQGNLIYGHGRILAARQRGDTDFPCIEIEGLSETQRRAFIHADNLLAESGTDAELLRSEMQALKSAGKWLAAQDRLTKQILSLGAELGLTPSARRARGLIAPK